MAEYQDISKFDETPKSVVHVDLDGASHIFATHGKKYIGKSDKIYSTGMRNILSFLDRNKIRATFFVIASDLDDPNKAELLKEAIIQGHEIASHSMTHPKLKNLKKDEKRVEIAESREKIEKTLNVTVQGFRAPNYQIDRDSLEILDECGYRYDSSVYPNQKFAHKIMVPAIPQEPYTPIHDKNIVELPLPDYKPSPFPFNPSYSLVLGNWYFNYGLKRFRRNGSPLIMLFHLIDFSEPLPQHKLNGIYSRIFTLSQLKAEQKVSQCQKMVDLVRNNYELIDTNALLALYANGNGNHNKVVLSISTTHETGASVIKGNSVLSAISEERLDRVKFSTKYPPKKSIDESIKVAGIKASEITDVIVAGLPPGRLAPVLVKGQIKDFSEFHGWIDYFPHFGKLLYRLFYFYRAIGYYAILRFLKNRYGIKPNIHFVEHHLAHAASAYRTAPFDNALIVTADGVGDDISLTISVGKDGRLQRLKEIYYPHSFGQFYTACTQVLGFRANRHEGKITGLSGFGKISPELYGKVKSTIRKSGEDFALDKRFYSEGIIRGMSLSKMLKGEDLFDALQYRNYKTPLKELLQGYSREDVAAVYQKLLEEEIAKVVQPFAAQTGLKNLALAGGLFANVKLNRSLFNDIGMENVYIFPHMGDGGLSVGAALEFRQTRPKPFDSVFWGPDYTERQIEKALKAARSKGLKYDRDTEIEKTIAVLLAQDKVVARFNGRMEFGPRALCNRTIFYNASDPKTNDWLNQRLGRTEFMPFAPVALFDKADLLFESISGVEHACKFMTIIVDCTDFTKEKCPAIVHVDGTARPQLVTEEINPSAYRILKYYEAETGIPLLVNTSFNMHEEPIVCSPEDAVRAFMTSRLDYLAIGPYLAWL